MHRPFPAAYPPFKKQLISELLFLLPDANQRQSRAQGPAAGRIIHQVVLMPWADAQGAHEIRASRKPPRPAASLASGPPPGRTTASSGLSVLPVVSDPQRQSFMASRRQLSPLFLPAAMATWRDHPRLGNSSRSLPMLWHQFFFSSLDTQSTRLSLI